MKTGVAGAVAGLILALFMFFFFRETDAGFTGSVLLLIAAPVGGFVAGLLGYKRP